MKPQDIFGIAVRLLGLVALGYGLQYVISYAFLALGQSAPAQGWSGTNYLVVGLLYLSVGLFLLRGAQHVVDFAYPRRNAAAESEPGVAQETGKQA